MKTRLNKFKAKCIYYTSLLFLLAIVNMDAQRPAPGAKQSKSIVLMNGIAHLGNGVVYERSAIGFKDGQIVLVQDLSSSSQITMQFDDVVDISGKHVYPGFILTNTTLGLREIDAVRATLDYVETGEMKPEVRSVVAFNTDSKIIPTVRRNGILIAQPTPRGGIISGQSGIVHLDGWNWEDAMIKMEDGIHIYWPARIRMISENDPDNNRNKLAEQRNTRINELKNFLEGARAYNLRQGPKEFDLRCESVCPVFEGRKRIYLHAEQEKEIIEAVNYLEGIGIKNIVLVGGDEAVNIIPFLKEKNIPVMLGRVHALPNHDDDDIKQPFRLAKIFWDSGILVTISYEGDMEAMGSRNLPFTAGTTITYGLDKEQAVQLITQNAAKILGIDSKYGTIEAGKSATIFVSSGDALDMISNNVELAFIDGRKITLDGSQEELYRIYKEKYGIK